ncbi:hypothetical protein LguiA_015324 [Lonicera macranthoides]
MFQPSFEMEARQNIYAPTTDLSIMKPLGQREDSRSPPDLMTRRLKNRERQRRYRARKRLEADMKKASCITNQPSPLQVNIQQVNSIISNFVSRIYCKRDWKKDARRAHVPNDHEVRFNGRPVPDSTSTSGSQAPVLDESEAHNRSTPSRRHWKAEARNKKN